MKAKKWEDLSPEHRCNACGQTKPLLEMVVIKRRRENEYYVRPLCKKCHNEKERGDRREYKREYLRKWRKRNAELNDSYWKGNPELRERARIRAAQKLQDQEYHDAILIQGRMRRKGFPVSLEEAKALLKEFGPCYPTRYGLTPSGLRECERIRSRLRNRKNKFKPIEIRMMVYAEGPGMYITPSRQKRPYQSAANTLRRWQQSQREKKAKEK